MVTTGNVGAVLAVNRIGAPEHEENIRQPWCFDPAIGWLSVRHQQILPMLDIFVLPWYTHRSTHVITVNDKQ